MADDNQQLVKQLREAELALGAAEKARGPNDPEVAEILLRYAALLRQTNKRTLEAVNVEARARAIRAKVFAAEDLAAKSATVPLIRPAQQRQDPTAAMGLGAMLLALLSLFINCQYFIALAALACVLMIGDLVLSRGTWWRALLTTLFLISGWFSIQSLPSIMLSNASPIDRLNYSSENAELVAKVRTLGKPTQALIYSLCLPEGFVLGQDEKTDWGRILTWNGETAGRKPKLLLMAVNPPADIRKKFRNYSSVKGAKELVLPDLYDFCQLTEVKQDAPEFEQINGMQFVRLNFVAKPVDSEQQFRGFIFVTKEYNRLVAIAGMDTLPGSAETLEPMEASVWTMVQQGRASDLDI
jgi:hypothetical protein